MPAPGFGWSGRTGKVVMKVGSCATGRCEPGQTLTGAALSRLPRVPQGHLAGAGYPALTRLVVHKGGLHGLLFPAGFYLKTPLLHYLNEELLMGK